HVCCSFGDLAGSATASGADDSRAILAQCLDSRSSPALRAWAHRSPLVPQSRSSSGAHADFTKQKVWAFTPSEVLSSLTTPSTLMRQLMLLPSLCAMMFGLAAGAVVVSVSSHGNDALSAF